MFNQQYEPKIFERHLCNQSSHYENMDNFSFNISKDEWNVKEVTGTFSP